MFNRSGRSGQIWDSIFNLDMLKQKICFWIFAYLMLESNACRLVQWNLWIVEMIDIRICCFILITNRHVASHGNSFIRNWQVLLNSVFSYSTADKFACEPSVEIIFSWAVISNFDFKLLVSAQNVTVGKGIDEIETPLKSKQLITSFEMKIFWLFEISNLLTEAQRNGIFDPLHPGLLNKIRAQIEWHADCKQPPWSKSNDMTWNEWLCNVDGQCSLDIMNQ